MLLFSFFGSVWIFFFFSLAFQAFLCAPADAGDDHVNLLLLRTDSSKQLLCDWAAMGSEVYYWIEEKPKWEYWGIPEGEKPLLHQHISCNLAYEEDKQIFSFLLWETFSSRLCSIGNSAVPCSDRLAQLIKVLHSLPSDIFLNSFDPWNIHTNKEIPLPPRLPTTPTPITCSVLCLWLDFWHIFAYIRKEERIKV